MHSSRGSATGSFAAWTRPRRRRVRPRDEGLQRLQVPPIAGVGPGELEASREFPEALLVHEETKRLLPELPLPDVRVAVEFRSEVAHRVVQVERPYPTESDALVDRPEERLVALPRPEVVARGERVACVDADPEAVRMGRAFHHLGELLESIADDRARPRRILQDREHIWGVRVLEAPVQACRDRLDGVRLTPPQVGSRVENHVPNSEDLGTIELLHERNAAVVEGVFVRACEVDQIVRVNDRARNPVRRHRFLERLRLLRRNRLRVSEHPRTAGENLNRVGPDRLAALRGERDALRDRDVGAEVHRSPRGNRLGTDELADVPGGRDGRYESRMDASSIPPGTPRRVSALSRPDTRASSGSPLARTNPRAPPTARPRPIFARPSRGGTARPPATGQRAPRSCRRP